MYREFEIGTAKPTHAERAEVPHHLLDCADPLADVTAGEYARQARQAIQEISGRERLPIVSGGTGLYLRALLEGFSQAHSDRKSCGNGCGNARTSAEWFICTAFYADLMLRLPSVFTPMTCPK